MLSRADTIAAVATASGPAALGIVRISGPHAGAVLDAIVPGARATSKPRRVLSSTAENPRSGVPIDSVLCFFCPAPRTATGEDTAEVHAHGGPLVLKQLLAAALQAGATAAEPGEFTYRAFRNGRIDLTQAEAVMSMIGARSERAASVAFNQLSGELGRSLSTELDAIIAVSAQVEAGLDFPDEDLPIEAATEMAKRLEQSVARLAGLRDTFALGSRLTEGARVAIIGPPNAGKSSLLNRLVGEDRALVDPEPGTTRDVVEARGETGGIPLVFSDTAGLRSDAGRVERRGIEKTINTAKGADMLIVVLDGAAPRGGDIADLAVPTHDRTLVVINKMDLPEWRDTINFPGGLATAPRVAISALTGQGIDVLLAKAAKMLGDRDAEDLEVLTTARQHAAVSACAEHLEKACRLLGQGSDPELAAADLRWARENLATLWGREATEEMLAAVFARFCIGK